MSDAVKIPDGKLKLDLVFINKCKGEFGLVDMLKAPAEVLVYGTMGSSFKATMSDDLTVFIKRIKEIDKIGKDGFQSYIRRLGSLKHNNILTSLAYYQKDTEKILIDEYIPRGSLLHLLHEDGEGASHGELNWRTRVKIIKGIAEGLGYLQSELGSLLDLPHGDLKSGNVLLGSNYDPILTGFGYSYFMHNNQCKKSLFAYRSPEAAGHEQAVVSPKSDVYCLGIIILELYTGKFPSLDSSGKNSKIDIVPWVKSAIAQGKEAELIDPDIAGTAGVNAEKLLHIGADCTETNPEQRPDIGEVISRIEAIQV